MTGFFYVYRTVFLRKEGGESARDPQSSSSANFLHQRASTLVVVSGAPGWREVSGATPRELLASRSRLLSPSARKVFAEEHPWSLVAARGAGLRSPS